VLPFDIATGQWFELQSIYTTSCKYWVLPPDTILPLQLQPNRGSSCNRCTLWVANTECFRMILYYLFSCNPTEVRVAIDVHSEFQILSAYTRYCTTSLVAIEQWFELHSTYTLSCNYWVLPPDAVLSLQLQPDSGSSCNLCTLRVANTMFSRISPSEWFALYIFPFWLHSN
jgi:hypothetical protein